MDHIWEEKNNKDQKCLKCLAVRSRANNGHQYVRSNRFFHEFYFLKDNEVFKCEKVIDHVES